MEEVSYIVRNTEKPNPLIDEKMEFSFANFEDAQKCCKINNLLRSDTTYFCNDFKIIGIEPRHADFATFEEYLKQDYHFVDLDELMDKLNKTISKIENEFYVIEFPDRDYFYEYGRIGPAISDYKVDKYHYGGKGPARELLLSDYKIEKYHYTKHLMSEEDISYVLSRQEEVCDFYEELISLYNSMLARSMTEEKSSEGLDKVFEENLD